MQEARVFSSSHLPLELLGIKEGATFPRLYRETSKGLCDCPTPQPSPHHSESLAGEAPEAERQCLGAKDDPSSPSCPNPLPAGGSYESGE